MNVVILRGTLSRDAAARTLPSGDRLVALEVTVHPPDGPAESVPVAWFGAPESAERLAQGTEVVVRGRVRRRFFRTASGTASRTEVVATTVARARQRTRVAALLGAAGAELAGEAEAVA
ncbi:MAG: single-stranded DNA-binding protein [Acidimicrobiales bacterium]|nr:single-stranded DNA-binding protein [Acidimicrobiales bacterium]